MIGRAGSCHLIVVKFLRRAELVRRVALHKNICNVQLNIGDGAVAEHATLVELLLEDLRYLFARGDWFHLAC